MQPNVSVTNSTIRLDSNLARVYSKPVRGQLQGLATAAKGGKDHWRVVCYQQDGGMISCKFHGFHYVWHIFIEVLTLWFGSDYLENNKKTIDYFNTIFGEDRIVRWEKTYERLEKKPFIWSERSSEKLELTKSDLKRLLGAVSCVTKTDVEMLLKNIQRHISIETSRSNKKGPYNILYLTEEQSLGLITLFKAKIETKGSEITIEDLNTDEVDFFYDLLKPFSFNEASLQSGENKETGYDRGYTMRGLLKLSGKIEEVRNSYLTPAIDNPVMICSDLEKKDAAAEVTLAKKVMGYYNPKGTMIRTKEGWFHVEHKLNSAGMYMVYLRAIRRQNADRLYFLHTQSMGFIPWKWQPLREILTRDSGQKGIREANSLREIIEPRLEEAPDGYKLKVYGYSLGAAGARRFLADSLARHKRSFITELVTFSGLGIDKDTADWIDQELDSRHGQIRSDITDYRNYGDRVSLMGESAPMPQNLVYFCKESELKSCRNDPKMLLQCYSNSWEVTAQIYRSINLPHCQEVSDETCFVTYTKEQDETTIRSLIDNRAPNYERQRQEVATWFSTKKRYIDYLRGLKAASTPTSAKEVV